MKASEASSAAILDPARDFVTIRERMERAPQIVQERLNRAVKALEKGGVQYAVVGGNAVGYWVGTVDEEAVRTTRDVDLMVARAQWAEVCQAMNAEGFVHRHVKGVDMFLDPLGPKKAIAAVHVIFAGERVNEKHEFPNPTLGNVTRFGEVLVLALPELVRMKLTSWRLKDQVQLEDMKGVGLLDGFAVESLPEVLRERFESIAMDSVEEAIREGKAEG